MRTRSKKRNKINVITLGCSKNIYDSEIIIKQLEASKKNVVHEEKGNIVVINTCGFINNAKQESIDTILEQIEYKQIGIVDKVYVTGCLSERYKNDLEKEIPDVDQYFGPKFCHHCSAWWCLALHKIALFCKKVQKNATLLENL